MFVSKKKSADRIDLKTLKNAVIAYSGNSRLSYDAASVLKSEFYAATGKSLAVVENSADISGSFIRIASSSDKSGAGEIPENEWRISVYGNGIIVTAGNDALLSTAVSALAKSVSELSADNSTVSSMGGIVTDFSAYKTVGSEKYGLVWSDEFNGNQLNSDYWSFRVADSSGKLFGTPTDTVYIDDARTCRVENGKLVLSTVSYSTPKDSRVKYATSHSITTNKSMSYKHGYLEMYAKQRYIKGIWNSLWLTGGDALNARDTVCGLEIDCFENAFLGELKPNIHKWYGSTDVAYNNSNTSLFHDNSSSPYKIKSGYYYDEAYHLYGFEWNEKYMIMYIDGNAYMTFDISRDFENYAKTGNSAEKGMDCFEGPLSVVLGAGIYSKQYAADNSWAEQYMFESNGELPVSMEIDWIRLYQPVGAVLNRK